MSKPIVEFTKIAQSGRCCDGRVIQPEWLREMAANYSQALYTALLWPEHMRWGNNWGEVIELEARDEAGGVALYARFMPNASYSWEKQYDQKLFYSIELNFEIMQDGSAYLEGLGVTDSPASLGMRPHRFSREAGKSGQAALSFSSNIAAVKVEQPEIPPGWFRAWAARFDNIFNKFSNFSEVTMTPEEIQALFDALKAELAALDARVSALEPKVEAAESKAEEAEKTAEQAEQTAAEAMEKVEEVAEFSKRLGTMEERFAKAAPGTETPENAGNGFKPLF